MELTTLKTKAQATTNLRIITMLINILMQPIINLTIKVGIVLNLYRIIARSQCKVHVNASITVINCFTLGQINNL